MRYLLLRGLVGALTALLLFAGLFTDTTGPARADVVLLKDGHVLQGKVRRESQVILEGGVPYEIPKTFFLVDDQVRRVIFGARQVEDVEAGDPAGDADVVPLRRQLINLDNWPTPNPLLLLSVTPWDDKGERTVKIRGPNTAATITQRVTVLTPYYLRADSLRYRWPVLYLTREYDPATVRGLLVNHPDLKPKGDSDDVLKRFRVFRFLLQAGWYEQADEELKAIAADLPDEKEKLDAARDQLRKLRTIEIVQEVQRAHEVGRGRWAQQVIAAVPPDWLDEKQQSRLRGLKAQYEVAHDRLALARRFLADVPPRIEDGTRREVFAQAAATILAELTAEAAGRLDAFVALAQQAERDRAQERKPAHGADQLMALAVSGWLLGNSVADTRVDVAIRLWRARRFALEYLRSHIPAERRVLLQAYQKDSPASADEFAQMVRLLPPPEADGGAVAAAGSQWLSVTANALLAPAHGLLAATHFPAFVPDEARAGGRPVTVKLQSDVPWRQRRGTDYWVQLPPEYQPGRLYPVLVALHHAGEGAEDILKRWGHLAAARGYVLVAPAWVRGVKTTYEFTADEHNAVTDVLWEVRRRFWVDADRVFLTGFGAGADMAFDVGLSQPHLFAGVLPMGGSPRYFARAYKYNGQYLPFYVVDGDRNGKSPAGVREQYNVWIPRGYPVLYVEYKGRALEWFAAELPHAFDWMARKKRVAAFPELGRGGGTTVSDEYASMRPTDNRFYWLSADGLANQHHNEAGRWRSLVAASLSGHILDGNTVSVRVRGFKRGTVWLGPGMVDFDKPITLRVNGAVAAGKRPVKPSLETLLEDLYQRGDRQRVYWAKVDFNT